MPEMRRLSAVLRRLSSSMGDLINGLNEVKPNLSTPTIEEESEEKIHYFNDEIDLSLLQSEEEYKGAQYETFNRLEQNRRYHNNFLITKEIIDIPPTLPVTFSKRKEESMLDANHMIEPITAEPVATIEPNFKIESVKAFTAQAPAPQKNFQSALQQSAPDRNGPGSR